MGRICRIPIIISKTGFYALVEAVNERGWRKNFTTYTKTQFSWLVSDSRKSADPDTDLDPMHGALSAIAERLVLVGFVSVRTSGPCRILVFYLLFSRGKLVKPAKVEFYFNCHC